MTSRLLLVAALLAAPLLAQPFPIQSPAAAAISVVPDGLPPDHVLGPEDFVFAPLRIYRRAATGTWLGIVGVVRPYVVDPNDQAAVAHYNNLVGAYQWLLPEIDSTDYQALQTAINQNLLVASPVGELATRFEVLQSRILLSASGGNRVRHTCFASLLPAELIEGYGSTYSDLTPINLQEWQQAPALLTPDPQVEEIKEAWKDGLVRNTSTTGEQLLQGELFDGFLLGKSLLRLQAPSAAIYEQFLNENTVLPIDAWKEAGIGVQFDLQAYTVAQANIATPQGTPNATPGVSYHNGPLIATSTYRVTFRTWFVDPFTGGQRPWTPVQHAGATLNGEDISPRLTPNGIRMELHGRGPFTMTASINGTNHSLIGRYDQGGKVFFTYNGPTLLPGTVVTIIRITNAHGALDLTNVTWTTLIVGQ